MLFLILNNKIHSITPIVARPRLRSEEGLQPGRGCNSCSVWFWDPLFFLTTQCLLLADFFFLLDQDFQTRQKYALGRHKLALPLFPVEMGRERCSTVSVLHHLYLLLEPKLIQHMNIEQSGCVGI